MFLNICLCEVVILFLSVMFHSAPSNVFYIVTSENSLCPGEFIGVPCLTLQQYASNPSQSQNITFVIESGTYNLSTELTVSNGYNFTMSSNATVSCTSSTARFSIDSVKNVHISGMTFQDCSNSFNDIESLHIKGVTFRRCRYAPITMTSVVRADILHSTFNKKQECTYYCGNRCLYVSSSSITINGSHFQNCRGTAIYASRSTVIILFSEFNHNGGNFSSGGAINSANSNITIDRSIFARNFARFGGAVNFYAAFPLTCKITHSAFCSNTASHTGGAIYYSYQQSFLVESTIFENNRARNGNGGAVALINYYRNIIISINNSQFINNTANGSGGAVYKSESNSVLIIDQNYFNNNTASSGGALSVIGTNNSVREVSSSFFNNKAHTFGGAIFISGANSSVSVSSSSFINNTAVWNGGGAIYSNGRYANVTLSSSTFNYNSASYCSVLYVDEFYHFGVNLTNSVFTYNTATGQTFGGGVACIRNASIKILNSVFKHNFANSHALPGVFYTDESVTTVDGSIFINNSAVLDGGVFYTYVHASDYIIRRSQFTDNAAGDDGGVMLIGRLNCFINIDESIFYFNSVADRGGVIALFGSSVYMEINRTNIFNNTAQFGIVISVCNSEVTFVADILTATVDPLLSFCTLYGGDIRDFNITIQDPQIIMTIAPPSTTKMFTTTGQLVTIPSTIITPPITTVPPTLALSTIAESPTTLTPPKTMPPPPNTTSLLTTTTALSPTTAISTTNDIPLPATTVGDSRDFDMTTPDPEFIVTTDTPITEEVPTRTASHTLATTEPPTITLPLTTTEAPTMSSPPTRTAMLTTVEKHTAIEPPDTISTPPSHPTQPNVTLALDTTATPLVIDHNQSTPVSPTTDTTSQVQNSNPTANIDHTSTSRSLDEDINQNHSRVQSTTSEHTQDDENLVTVMAVVTDSLSRLTFTYIAIGTASLVVSLAIAAIMIVLVLRFRHCISKNEWNLSKASLNEDSNVVIVKFTVTDETCSLPTYISPVFDPNDENNFDAELSA